MTVSITLGWWIAPALITALLFILAIIAVVRTSGQWLSGVVAVGFLFLATLFSIIAWLTWGVLA